MSPEFASLLSQNIGVSFAKQIAFADLIGERNWGVSMSEGVATFGTDLSFPIQLLGTEADGDASWLWAWANEQSNLPPNLLKACNECYDLGSTQQVPEFTDRSFSQNIADGHMIALVASGLHPNCCYYRGPYDGGALFFLVCDVPRDVVGPVAPERAVTVMTEVISQFEINHRDMADSFLRSQGFTLQPAGNRLDARRDKDSLTVTFDSMQRINKIDCTLNSAEAT
ncbi:DUF6882 domain-containing protein [Rhodopirellula sp. JC639]|uniref:DUF6882 domain-containing protein n=1 Tax=Stieleria mannarensis TaxID=2755585 RepID=UPI001603596B|nr:DUF6882 domain-containing protein [Rhodopirellula sp. JC639]